MPHQSPIAKNRPTTGSLANESTNEDDLIGGNKHSTTGGGQDQFSSNRNAASRSAAGNHGVEEGPDRDNFLEPDADDLAQRSQGSTLTKAGVS